MMISNSNKLKKIKKIHIFSSKYYLYDAFFILSIIYLTLKLNSIDLTNISYTIEINSNEIDIIDFEGFDNKNAFQNELIIPNIIHYLIINNNKTEMSSNHLASMISAHYYQKPTMIFIHHSNKFKIPQDILNIINRFKIEYKILSYEINDKIFGKHPQNKSHINEVNKLLLLMEYGGIYLDEDLILFESINHLRCFEAVIVLNDKKNKKYNSKLIMGHRNSRIFKSFYDSFRTNESIDNILKHNDYLSKAVTFKYMNLNEINKIKPFKEEEVIKLWDNSFEFMKFINKDFKI